MEKTISYKYQVNSLQSEKYNKQLQTDFISKAYRKILKMNLLTVIFAIAYQHKFGE